MPYNRNWWLSALRDFLIFGVAAFDSSIHAAARQSAPVIVVSPAVPNELNPPFKDGSPSMGGAPAATPAQSAAFAWQEFMALNWPAGPQQGQPNQRDTPSSTCRFGDPSKNCALLVWETFRGKVEIFPGNGSPPPGYSGSTAATSWGYDVLPAYIYGAGAISSCDTKQANDPTPWINLDETDQITLDSMYAGVVKLGSSPGNSSPQLIRFLAKANRSQLVYVAGNSSGTDQSRQWWRAIPTDVVNRTRDYLTRFMKSPPENNSTMVSLPYGTIEVKAAWRPLNPSEIASGRFHTQTVRFYESASDFSPCYRDSTTWGLVALHIIQKTPSAPYFIYATFEQADNILSAEGKTIENADGLVVQPQPATATTPQVCLFDPKPNHTPPPPEEITSALGSVILTTDPKTCKPLQTANYCGAPGSRLYYRNENNGFANPPPQPIEGDICVDKRDNAIPDYVIAANRQAHGAISKYLQQSNINSAPWLSYKLVNVQYYPYDKIPPMQIRPNGSPYQAQPPYSATNPAPSSFYQANIVVETNRSLQLFAGGLSLGGNGISTEWNQDGTPHKNTYYGGQFVNMGGCMGCHGSQGQNPNGMAGDFSVILARGILGTGEPEVPAIATSQGMSHVPRNRSLK